MKPKIEDRTAFDERVAKQLTSLAEENQKLKRELSKTKIDWQNSVMYWNAKCEKLKKELSECREDNIKLTKEIQKQDKELDVVLKRNSELMLKKYILKETKC